MYKEKNRRYFLRVLEKFSLLQRESFEICVLMTRD